MKKGLKVLTIFTSLFILAFIIRFLLLKNYEFLGYIVVVIFLFSFILYLDKIYNFPLYSLWLFVGWIVLHMFGGGLYVNGNKLYATILINLVESPYFILKYDQFVHAYCYFAFSILIYYILKKHLKGNNPVLIIFTVLSAIGIGLLNEIIEFGMVVFANAGSAVGDYYNTSLDMVFNLVGAVIGAFFAKRVSNRV